MSDDPQQSGEEERNGIDSHLRFHGLSGKILLGLAGLFMANSMANHAAGSCDIIPDSKQGLVCDFIDLARGTRSIPSAHKEARAYWQARNALTAAGVNAGSQPVLTDEKPAKVAKADTDWSDLDTENGAHNNSWLETLGLNN